MTMLDAFFQTLNVFVDPITVGANWGTSTGVGTRTSAAQTLTVPAANPGNITIGPGSFTGAPTLFYKKNAGTFTACDVIQVVAVVSTDTITLRVGGGSGDVGQIVVTDGATGALIGDFIGTLT